MRVVTAKSELCSGCRACQALCSLTLFRENNPGKSGLRIIGHFPEPGVYEIITCSQCGVCARECPVGAIQANEEAYIIDDTLCTGCGLCVSACPVGSMARHAAMTTPIKCVSCGECVKYCPRRALELRENSGDLP